MKSALSFVLIALCAAAASAAYVPNESDGHFFYKSHGTLSADGGAMYGQRWTEKSDEDNTVLDLYEVYNETLLKAWKRPLGDGQYDSHVALFANGAWQRGPEQQPRFDVTLGADGKTVVSVTVSIVAESGVTVSRTLAPSNAPDCIEDGQLTRDPRACCGQLGAPVSDEAWVCGSTEGASRL